MFNFVGGNKMKSFSIAFLLMLISTSILFGQGTSGKLTGTVSGPDGLLPGATVFVRDNNSRREVTVTTNADGAYQVPQLEFGTYTIRITAPGFKTLIGNDQKIGCLPVHALTLSFGSCFPTLTLFITMERRIGVHFQQGGEASS